MKLQVRNAEEVKKEIEAVRLYQEKRVILPGVPQIVYALASQWDGKQVFLQDGDALVYPLSKLKEVLVYINEKLPQVERIAAYATANDILRIDVEDLKELQRLKLGILYVGLESGDDDVLKKICKNISVAQITAAVKRVKAAGILTSVTVILGMGGPEGSEKHTVTTAKALTDMDPEYIGALTVSLIPGTPLYDDFKRGKFKLITPFESVKELLQITKLSSFTNCFFSSMHASNYFSVRGRLPEDKARMVRELEEVIKRGDPGSLRPEFLRGL
jgi:radical SAM superfamily enzyme YgiQ (UPF0313 family)